MAHPNRIREMAQERGVEPDQLVLDALNEHQTLVGTADALGISFQAIWEYSHKRFEKVCRWRRIRIVDMDFTATLSVPPIVDEGQSQ